MTGEPLLRVRGLCKDFGAHRAVDEVAFDLHHGETLGIVGESGSGKSTTARLILQLLRPTAGSVRFGGRELTELRGAELRRARRDIQMVFQDPYASLDPRQRVREILEEPLTAHGVGTPAERRARVGELLDLVGLDANAGGRRPHEFSGGQRQRIAIARALALSPSLVLCDEPVSALDVSIQAHILNLLRDLQDRLGVAYLFISHDLGVVRVVSDRIVVMRAGRVVESGMADAVYEHPSDSYTRALLDAVPLPDPARMRARRAARAAAGGGAPSGPQPISPTL